MRKQRRSAPLARACPHPESDITGRAHAGKCSEAQADDLLGNQTGYPTHTRPGRDNQTRPGPTVAENAPVCHHRNRNAATLLQCALILLALAPSSRGALAETADHVTVLSEQAFEYAVQSPETTSNNQAPTLYRFQYGTAASLHAAAWVPDHRSLCIHSSPTKTWASLHQHLTWLQCDNSPVNATESYSSLGALRRTADHMTNRLAQEPDSSSKQPPQMPDHFSYDAKYRRSENVAPMGKSSDRYTGNPQISQIRRAPPLVGKPSQGNPGRGSHATKAARPPVAHYCNETHGCLHRARARSCWLAPGLLSDHQENDSIQCMAAD